MDIGREGMSEEEEKKSREYNQDAYVNLSMRDSHRIDLAIGAYRKVLMTNLTAHDNRRKSP